MAFLYRSTCFQFSEDLDVGEELTNKVYIRDHDCVDHIEKLYYSSGLKNQPICIHCARVATFFREIGPSESKIHMLMSEVVNKPIVEGFVKKCSEFA